MLCETGFKDLFPGLFSKVCENPNQQRTLKINSKWTPHEALALSMQAWASRVNAANLGKGSDMVRLLALNQIKQDQQPDLHPDGPIQSSRWHSGT